MARLFARIGLTILWVALWLAPAAAFAQGTATDVIDSIQAEQEHLAKGELLYGNKWLHITDLFDEYGAGRKEGQIIIDRGRAIIGQLTDLQKKVLQARADEEAKERATRDDFSKAKSRQAECKRTLGYSPPAEPKSMAVPPEPQASAYSVAEAYEKAHKDWEARRAAADRDLKRRQEQRERDLDRYKQSQTQAAKDLKAAEEAVAKAEKTLRDMQAEFQTAQEPLLRQHAALSQEAQGIGRQANVILNRMTIMGSILKKAPEGLRLQYGILEWDGLFRPVSDMEAILASTKTEIADARTKAKAEADAQGRSLPADWHHPKEKDVETLTTLVDRCREVQAAPLYPPKPATKGTPAKESPKK